MMGSWSLTIFPLFQYSSNPFCQVRSNGASKIKIGI